MPYLTEEYGNPSSAYRFGKQAAEAVENGRGAGGEPAGMRAEGNPVYELRHGIEQLGDHLPR